MKLGVSLPQTEIGGEPAAARDFVQNAEAIGYRHLAVYDHVVGVNPLSRPGGDEAYSSEQLLHDPFVLLGFLAGQTESIELSVQVLILSQRQTTLVAKQSASLDVLSNGRFRLGVGNGWNEPEFVALGEDFSNRGKRSEEQVSCMKALWREPHVKFQGDWHNIPDVGINPLPKQQPLAVWFGGEHDLVLRRIARIGDGWMLLSYPPNAQAKADIDKLMAYVHAEGRGRSEVGIDAWVSMGGLSRTQWREELLAWQALGATHITLNTDFRSAHHYPIGGSGFDAHAQAIQDYYDTVVDLL